MAGPNMPRKAIWQPVKELRSWPVHELVHAGGSSTRPIGITNQRETTLVWELRDGDGSIMTIV